MQLESVYSVRKQLYETYSKSEALMAAAAKAFPFPFSSPRLPFAVGVRLTENDNDYKVAIRLPNKWAAALLLRPELQKVLPARMELDVEVVDDVQFIAANPLVHSNPALKIGAPVRHFAGAGGTLGFFAKREGKLGIVSCNHVIARLDQGVPGDRVDGPSAVPMSLDGEYPHLTTTTPPVKKADCAFAIFVNGDVPQRPGALEGTERLKPTPVIPSTETRVKKIGASTGVRTGRIVVRELDGFPVPIGPNQAVIFDDVLEIRSDSTFRRFSNAGDSGALVYTADDQRPVGLLFADKRTTKLFKKGLSYANRFEHVTTALGVTLVV